jgi:hypothetical protein
MIRKPPNQANACHVIRLMLTPNPQYHVHFVDCKQEALDLRAAQACTLVTADFCELGKDFSRLAEPLCCSCCSSPKSDVVAVVTGTSAGVLAIAGVLHRMRWMNAIAAGLENDFISLEKKKKAGVLVNAAIIDLYRGAAVLRLLYRRMEEEVSSSAVALEQRGCCERRNQEVHEQQRSVWEYLATIMAHTRGVAQGQLIHMQARYRMLAGTDEPGGQYDEEGPSLYVP